MLALPSRGEGDDASGPEVRSLRSATGGRNRASDIGGGSSEPNDIRPIARATGRLSSLFDERQNAGENGGSVPAPRGEPRHQTKRLRLLDDIERRFRPAQPRPAAARRRLRPARSAGLSHMQFATIPLQRRRNPVCRGRSCRFLFLVLSRRIGGRNFELFPEQGRGRPCRIRAAPDRERNAPPHAGACSDFPGRRRAHIHRTGAAQPPA